MDPKAWLTQFRVLHDKARRNQLKDEERRRYMDAREQLARTLCAAQGLTTEPGKTARQSFRVAHAFQIELSLNAGPVRIVTLDISRGGFSALVANAPDGAPAMGRLFRRSERPA